jgi:hypothetical protein
VSASRRFNFETLPPRTRRLATLAGGASIGCCLLLLRDSFKAGKSCGSKWVGFFRRAVQLPLECVDAPKLVIDALGAKGRLRLRPEYLEEGLIRNAESVVSLSRTACK